jgi:protein arginine N-methyltransferase 6
VEVIQGKMEEVELPEKVDVIVSEWMGFYLLHESMLGSVIWARDRWLKEGGLVLPSRARIFLCPVSMNNLYKEKFEFWKDVYGLDFSALIPTAKAQALAQPEICIVESSQLLSYPLLVKEIDCLTVQPTDLTHFSCPFSFPVKKDDTLHGFCAWFEVLFDTRASMSKQVAGLQKESLHNNIHSSNADLDDVLSNSNGDDKSNVGTSAKTLSLSTAPGEADTHWKQTVVLLPEGYPVEQDECIDGVLTLSAAADNPRFYNISIQLGSSTETANNDDDRPEPRLEGHEVDCGCVACYVLRECMEQYS